MQLIDQHVARTNRALLLTGVLLLAILGFAGWASASYYQNYFGGPRPSSLAGSFIMSYVLWHSILFGNAYVKMSGPAGGLMGGFFGWLGYIVPVTLMTKLYEKKPWGLWMLDNAFWLISLLVMGVILSSWM